MHKTEITVRGYHTDFYGHINNARYLELLEEARWRLTEEHIDYNEWARKGYAFVVVNVNISYRHPAKVGDIIEIQSSLKELKSKSGTVTQKIFLKGTKTLVADADITFVILNIKSNKSEDIRGELKDLLLKLGTN